MVAHVYGVDDVAHVQGSEVAVVLSVKESLSERCEERDDANRCNILFAQVGCAGSLGSIDVKFWVVL